MAWERSPVGWDGGDQLPWGAAADGDRWEDWPPVRVACAVNAAWDALTYVRHPDVGLDVVTLGLVYDVRVLDGAIVVDMTLRWPGAPAGAVLPGLAAEAVHAAVPDAVAVWVRLVWDPPWTPAMIDRPAAGAAGQL